jgi:NTP pyrophosphatase (non-canonical NTP hydrolase)
MTTIELNDFIRQSYRNAKLKGFYIDYLPDEAYIAAIHDELSEAFREWNKYNRWYALMPSDQGPKAEGIYPELADAVIRLFSYCGYKGLSLKDSYFETDRPYGTDDFCDFILKSHESLVEYYELIQKETRDDYDAELLDKCCINTLSQFVKRIELFISESSDEKYSLIDLVTAKIAYNTKRSVKHGGHKV